MSGELPHVPGVARKPLVQPLLDGQLSGVGELELDQSSQRLAVLQLDRGVSVLPVALLGEDRSVAASGKLELEITRVSRAGEDGCA